jgi:hypothetical protein
LLNGVLLSEKKKEKKKKKKEKKKKKTICKNPWDTLARLLGWGQGCTALGLRGTRLGPGKA